MSVSGEFDRSVSPAVGGRGLGLIYGLAAFVSLIGLADATYLTVEHLAGRTVRCTVTSGCDVVLQSAYATLPGGLPLAALGALAYFTAFSLATLAAFGYTFARAVLVPVAGTMLLMTLWLLYLQAFVINAFCAFCLLSAAVTATLCVLVAVGWLRGREPKLP